MTPPRVFLIRMVVFLAAVAAVAAVLAPTMAHFFLSNPALNGLILGVGLVGIILNFRHVVSLGPEVRWIEAFSRGQASVSSEAMPRLLSPMATMLAEHKERGRDRGRYSLSAIASRALLDGIAARLDENREMARYFVGLCVFLGLLGTFWGLLETVGSIARVIGTLSLGEGDLNAVFSDLKAGLEAPLSGMGTAFSSSLFGLSSSLVLGFLDLQAGQAQNSFYNALEDWLSKQTRLGSGAGTGDGDTPVPAYLQALLEKTADSLDDLQRTIARSQETSLATGAQIRDMAETVAVLADQMRTEQAVLLRLAETHADLRPVLTQLSESMTRQATPHGALADEQMAAHVRNVDAAVTYIANQTVQGREVMLKELRGEIRMLARTIAGLDPASRPLAGLDPAKRSDG
ncbi:flagellar motor protein MotA [Pararhodospirillum oryzae]|uniref:Flagellar motor protein MotA n=1 Tax=Pararhodospirillum oryzae TaxID=478448 RepID=A0A512HC24_9PROT|nr:flagellar motor protein MotA [Pararhodospirillum oryzae]GEO82993.1 flagellar motor protein MotA [Pararhodospirillum oryzae]